MILSQQNLNDISDDLCFAYINHRRQAAFLEINGAPLTKESIGKLWMELHLVRPASAAALSFDQSSSYQEKRIIKETIIKIEKQSKYCRNNQSDATHS